jgi:isoleucyl-tRNA synthetase
VGGPGAARLARFTALLEDEVNVKRVELQEGVAELARFRLQPNPRVLGPRLGEKLKAVLAAARAGEFERLPDGRVRVAGEALEPEEFTLRLEAREGLACEAIASGEVVVLLDLEVSEELRQEGLARDLVRAVQQARKDAGLHVVDRIRLALSLPDEVRAAAARFRDYVAEQTLAVEIDLDGRLDRANLFTQRVDLGGPGEIALAKA